LIDLSEIASPSENNLLKVDSKLNDMDFEVLDLVLSTNTSHVGALITETSYVAQTLIIVGAPDRSDCLFTPWRSDDLLGTVRPKRQHSVISFFRQTIVESTKGQPEV
jgi:hypothetical protein